MSSETPSSVGELDARGYRGRVIRFLIVFGVLSAGSSLLETAMMKKQFGEGYQVFLAGTVAGVTRSFGLEVERQGRVLLTGGPPMYVTVECSGVLATGLFCAGVLAFPCGWGRRLVGVGVGVIGVGLLNLARLIVLTVIARVRPGMFNITHDVLMQGFLLLLVAPLWIAWLVWALRGKRRSGAAVRGA